MSYNEISFSGKTYRGQHIEYLSTVGRLFGLPPPDPSRARVLEIGCSTGTHIIPQALEYPASTFIGIDIADKQLEVARRAASALSLRNVQFLEQKIEEFEEAEPFDYILCHGVYSWVPQETKEAIINAFSTHLSDNGIGVLSYNCEPGWHVREIISSWLTKRAAGKELTLPTLQKLGEELKKLFDLVPYQFEKPYTLLLHHELYRILKEPLSYLRYEYLESGNSAEWHADFCRRLQGANLYPISDARLSRNGCNRIRQFHSDDNKSVFIAELAKNSIEEAALFDMLYGNSFRETIVAKYPPKVSTVSVNNPEMYLGLTPLPFEFETAEEIDESLENLLLQSDVSGEIIESSKVVLKELNTKAPAFVRASDLTLLSSERQKVLTALVERDLVVPSDAPPVVMNRLDACPKALPWVQYQASQGASIVTNVAHFSVELGIFERRLLSLLDGSRTKEDLIDNFEAFAAEGGGAIKEDGVEVLDPVLRREHISQLIEDGLNFALKSGLLALGSPS